MQGSGFAELREAIEASLEAAHSEYREANQRVRRSATVLLMVALLYLSFGLLLYLVSAGDEFTPLTELESRQRIGALVDNTLVGSALLGSYFATRRAPLPAFVAALGVWMAQVLAFSLAPSTLLLAFLSASGVALLMAKIVVFVLLVLGAVAAHRRNEILRALARRSTQQGSEGLS